MAMGGLRSRAGAGSAPAPTAAELEAASGLVFGINVFRNSTTQFFPNVDGPFGANYRLGPGDRLVLILTGDLELAHTLDVTSKGS